jgi:poly(3-hydroxybutyrate) depolymerase
MPLMRGWLSLMLWPMLACSQSVAGLGDASARADSAVALDAAPLDAAPLDAADFTPPDRSPIDAAGSRTRYHIDLQQTSVSGLSSGGFMAVQFHLAFSSIMKGAAIFAGGPYRCSQGSLTVAESSCASGVPASDIPALVAQTQANATAGAIDDPANLDGQRVFLFGGADDLVVNPTVMDALAAYYRSFMPGASIDFVSRRPGTTHTWPTLSYGNPCDLLASPYMGSCGYDGAGAALAQIYGPLAAPATNLSGSFLSLPQSQFIANPASHSLADTAHAYVPASCAAGETCALHVAFHGCLQSESQVGDAFYRHAGLNEWADTNHLIMIYPQTVSSPSNAEACWDFWGYDSRAFDQKTGPQMAMVRALIDWFVSAGLDG